MTVFIEEIRLPKSVLFDSNLTEWCEDNIGVYTTQWNYILEKIIYPSLFPSMTINYIFQFTNKEDALLFKLTWC